MDKEKDDNLELQKREEVLKKMEVANDKKEELLNREEALQGRKELGGVAEAGTTAVKKVETDEEYAERVTKGEANPLLDDTQ